MAARFASPGASHRDPAASCVFPSPPPVRRQAVRAAYVMGPLCIAMSLHPSVASSDRRTRRLRPLPSGPPRLGNGRQQEVGRTGTRTILARRGNVGLACYCHASRFRDIVVVASEKRECYTGLPSLDRAHSSLSQPPKCRTGIRTDSVRGGFMLITQRESFAGWQRRKVRRQGKDTGSATVAALRQRGSVGILLVQSETAILLKKEAVCITNFRKTRPKAVRKDRR